MKRAIFLLAGLGFALPVAASPSVPLKCGANLDRVWVYDNLTTLDVSVRLKCGTPVDVLGMEKSYVKIRTADGDEGYVPADAMPSSELAALTAAAPPVAPAPTVATAARPMMPAPAQPVATTQPIAAIQPAAPSVPPRAVAAPAQPVAIRTSVTPAPQPEPRTVAMATPSAPSMPLAPSPAPAAPPAQQSKPAPAGNPVPAQSPAPAPIAPPVTHAAVAQSAPRPAARPNAMPNATANATIIIEPTKLAEQPKAPAPAPSPAPVQLAMVVKAADITPISKAAAVHDAEYSDEDDTPDTVAMPAEDLASCNVYFSAYGVTPMQYKWIADDRRRQTPGVCPAPQPSMVDYVVIFTHDENFFFNTLPDPVHTDKNGFSDWSPVTAADDTHIPIALMDKAHHEYAWVFHIRRGTFDPSNFTSRRHPQFTKTESSAHASSKSIADAMQFIADNTHP